MKNELLYNKTVDILVQAYFEGTLKHDSCSSCAVGTLLGHSRWTNLFLTTKCKPSQYQSLLHTDGLYFSNLRYQNLSDKKLISQIEFYGYSWQYLSKIEFAFESASQVGDYMFNGLMAVIDVLDIIHENTDSAVTAHSKQLFVYA